MSTILDQTLVEIDANASKCHAANVERLEKERAAAHCAHQRSERARAHVRTSLAALLDSQQAEGVPLEEMLWIHLKFSAAILAHCDLDEPIDLKIRRLGRNMKNKPIEF